MRPGLEQLYLVDELIPVAGLVDIWGKAKCFKSFWTLDLMFHVAMGKEYRDRSVQQGTVVYCAFEGAHGYKKRIEAIRLHYEIDDDLHVPLYIMPGQANLIAEHKVLIRDIQAQLGGTKLAAVVLDTLNKSLLGSESKDTDMSAYVRAAEAVRDAFGCVEPISKSFEEDDEAGKLDKAEEILGVVLPANEDPALPLNPGEEALDEPASHVAALPSPILRGRFASVAPMRRDDLDAVLSQLRIQRIAVICAIADQVFRLGFDHVEVET